MRLFTGIDLPPEVKRKVSDLLERLRPAARLNWRRVENFHITTKFIGEWPGERLEELIDALGGLPARESIPIAIRGLGWFPNERSPRVFWVGIEAPTALEELSRDTDHLAAGLGVPEEKRRFSPHLTLARIKERVPLDALQRAMAGLPSVEFGGFTADRFHLYQSELRTSGSVYTKLAEFPFGQP